MKEISDPYYEGFIQGYSRGREFGMSYEGTNACIDREARAKDLKTGRRSGLLECQTQLQALVDLYSTGAPVLSHRSGYLVGVEACLAVIEDIVRQMQ